MRQPPPISRIARYPVTGGTAILAILTTLIVQKDPSWMSALDMDYSAFHGQPWRLLSGALPHLGIFHLLFDVYWLWVFGTLIEETFGSIWTAVLFVILAAGSSAAEFAFFSGGVGLSGVGYGLFGFLWVLSRFDTRLRGIVDQQTIIVFVVWFFLCIFLTITGTMAIGNVAHGAGAVLGMLAALIPLARAKQLPLAIGALVLVLLGIGWAATGGRPLLNFSSQASDQLAHTGYDAYQKQDYPTALKFFRMATSYRKVNPLTWMDLGLTYENVGQIDNAYDAFNRASQLDPTSQTYKQAAARLRPLLSRNH